MHEELQQWEIHPRFPVHSIIAILIGMLTGLAFGYLIHNIVLGAVFGLVAGVASALALGRISRDKSFRARGRLRLWALAPLLGFMTLTVLLWAYQLSYL